MDKLALLATTALLTALAAGGGSGGGASGAPTDASADDFCAAFIGVFTGDGGDTASITGADINDWGEALADTGTPDDITDDARAGFEIITEYASEVDSNADIGDIEDPDVSGDEQDQVDAFLEYAGTTCAQAMQDALMDSAG